MYREVKLLEACYKMHYRKEQRPPWLEKRVRDIGEGREVTVDRPSKIRSVNFSLFLDYCYYGLLYAAGRASILVNYSRWKKFQLYSDR